MRRGFRVAVLAGILSVSVTLTGCFASLENQIAKDGSLFGTSRGDYIVINSSGDLIMDIYKLKDAYVDSEMSSDGWNFIDNKGNVVMLGGDVKVIRVKDDATWDSYQEYHYDLEFVEGLKAHPPNSTQGVGTKED